MVGVAGGAAKFGPEYDYTYSPFEVAVNTCPNAETIFSCPVNTNHGNIWITEITNGSLYYFPGPSAGELTAAWNMGYTPWKHFHDLFGYEGDDSYDKDTRVRQFYIKGYNRRSGSLMVETPNEAAGELSMPGAAPYKSPTTRPRVTPAPNGRSSSLHTACPTSTSTWPSASSGRAA